MVRASSQIKLVELILILLLFLIPVASNAEIDKLRVVTSFTILEDLVKELGGEHVRVVNLVPRDSDAHLYQPIP